MSLLGQKGDQVNNKKSSKQTQWPSSFSLFNVFSFYTRTTFSTQTLCYNELLCVFRKRGTSSSVHKYGYSRSFGVDYYVYQGRRNGDEDERKMRSNKMTITISLSDSQPGQTSLGKWADSSKSWNTSFWQLG